MYQISDALRLAIDQHKPQRVLLVFSDREFSNEDISMSQGIIVNEDFNSQEELTIGLCPSYTLRFTLLNDSAQLSGFEFGWFTAYLGARIDSGVPTEITRQFPEGGTEKTYAFAPLGTFYAEKPKVIAKKTINVTAYDQMILSEHDLPSSTDLGITYPTTIGTIYECICYAMGVTPVTLQFLNSDLEVAEEPEEFSQAKIRDVLSWIAECACSIARFNRDSQLEFAWFTDVETIYNESSYSKFSPAWYSTEAINGLYCRDTDKFTETSVGVNKTNNYLIMDNPFLREG